LPIFLPFAVDTQIAVHEDPLQERTIGQHASAFSAEDSDKVHERSSSLVRLGNSLAKDTSRKGATIVSGVSFGYHSSSNAFA
jgi:hypothetical protein